MKEDRKKRSHKIYENDPGFWRIPLLEKELGSFIITLYGKLILSYFRDLKNICFPTLFLRVQIMTKKVE
ncbi:MAG: hypothetical protein LRY73_07660 [Bacillus sp. (in: Bacteria)]|nr:hypothetical protein [Bacillus sp. (in: firmicutes)]